MKTLENMGCRQLGTTSILPTYSSRKQTPALSLLSPGGLSPGRAWDDCHLTCSPPSTLPETLGTCLLEIDVRTRPHPGGHEVQLLCIF